MVVNKTFFDPKMNCIEFRKEKYDESNRKKAEAHNFCYFNLPH